MVISWVKILVHLLIAAILVGVNVNDTVPWYPTGQAEGWKIWSASGDVLSEYILLL